MQLYKKLGILCLFIASALSTIAQKKQYTMAEATNGLSTTLAPKAVKQGGWRPGTHQFYYRIDKSRLKVFNADTRDTTITDQGFIDALDKRAGFTWVDKTTDYVYNNDTLNLHSRTTIDNGSHDVTNIRGLPKGATNLHIDPIRKGYAFTKDNNLYYSAGANNAPVAVTDDLNKDIINGQAVHRNEFGITDGIFFSPKGNYLAYYRMDQTMVADYPVIDWSTTPAKNENVKYPMAGGVSHQVTLQVYNVATKQTTAIKTTGPKDQYLTCISWSPDEKYIYIAIVNRDQNHLWLNQYNAKTGEKMKTLLQETSDKYVEPQHALSFLPGSTNQFIWWSQRDGYMHLWLCDISSNSMRCLTPGEYVVNDLLGFNERRNELLFTSAKEDPRDKHGYAVNWGTGKMRRLDTEPGIHTYTASEDGEYLFDVFTYAFAPEHDMKGNRVVRGEDAYITKRSVIRSVDGKIIKTLMDAPDPLAAYDRPLIFSKVLTAADGTKLYGRLVLPTNFDPLKKYPVIVYLYNGPHVQLIKNGFPASGNLWYEYLAQHGYIVWTMDGRGSANRGLKFEQAIFRRLGTLEMEDHMRGVDYLNSLPYVDASRMGIHGWSYGGFMTTTFMLRNPGVFKVGVAGGPVMDWKMYEIMYGERYMDSPQQNPEGYKDSRLIDKVKNLKGKLLLIHGAQDATVVWQHSVNFLKEAVSSGVQVDYFIYPGYEHNVRGKDRVHLMQKITNYFDDYLK